MKRINTIYFIMIICLTGILSCSQGSGIDNDTSDKNSIADTDTPKTPVIFDTDIGNDIDDVLALNMLLNYHKKGMVDLIGVTISKSNPRVIEYVDAFCRYNKCPGIPIGYAYNGVNPNDGKYVPQTLDTLINGAPVMHPEVFYEDSLPEAHILQRKLLSEQPDSTVILIVVGPETNIGRLLNSGPDEYSSLTGVELVARKVKMISVMGGLYTDEFDFPEWNIINDLEASQTLFGKCPVQLVASGWETGNMLRYPHQSIENDFTNGDSNPLCISYKVYNKMPYDRPTWDLTSVLYAIEPDSSYFKLSPAGKINIDSEGYSTLEPSENGKHIYISIDQTQHERTLNALVKRVVGSF